MVNKTLTAPRIAEIATKIVSLLEPLTSEERRRAIAGSLNLLGEASVGEMTALESSGPSGRPVLENGKADPSLHSLGARAKGWMKQNSLSAAEIEQVFDISSEDVILIASEIPGKDGKERTLNAYVLQGLTRFLATGDNTFDDKAARKVCENAGCYQPNNHATYIADKRNLFAGAKASGWKLTAPGLKHGAGLVKQLTKEG